MYWGQTDPKKFAKKDISNQRITLLKEIDVHIKRWVDSNNIHGYAIKHGGSYYDIEAVRRNRMFIKDLKSLYNLANHLRTDNVQKNSAGPGTKSKSKRA